jgi:hypothetical protein
MKVRVHTLCIAQPWPRALARCLDGRVNNSSLIWNAMEQPAAMVPATYAIFGPPLRSTDWNSAPGGSA